MRVRSVRALGIALAVILPAVGETQMIRRSAPPQRMGGGEVSAPMIRRESSQPPIRMGSRPQYNAPVIVNDGYYGGYSGGYYDRYYNRGYSYGGRPYSSCYYSSFCRSYISYVPHVVSTSYTSYEYVYRTYVGWPWWVVPYYYAPVYTTFWAPTPAKIWTPGSASSPAAAPADSTKPRPLTSIAGGGDVMRIESVSDSVARVTWLGTTRPIRQARLFLADSVQQSLRGALVDHATPSALLTFSDLAPRIAYVGLTITLADGTIETTLVPYKPRLETKR
jgi:hypothetical protein